MPRKQIVLFVNYAKESQTEDILADMPSSLDDYRDSKDELKYHIDSVFAIIRQKHTEIRYGKF